MLTGSMTMQLGASTSQASFGMDEHLLIQIFRDFAHEVNGVLYHLPRPQWLEVWFGSGRLSVIRSHFSSAAPRNTLTRCCSGGSL
jgi:hypothetical protein